MLPVWSVCAIQGMTSLGQNMRYIIREPLRIQIEVRASTGGPKMVNAIYPNYSIVFRINFNLLIGIFGLE